MARQAPRHLESATGAWWRHVIDEYDLEQHHERLLTAACEAWDRMTQAREAVTAAGLTVVDRYGQVKPHPLLSVEKDSRIAFARLVRELDLDGEPGPDPRMPRR